MDWRLSHRTDIHELLDEESTSPYERHRSLDDLRRMNALLFGVRATLDPLFPHLRRAPKPVTVLDIGTGSGQNAQAIVRWAMREQVAVRVIALDLSPVNLVYAKNRGGVFRLPLLAADAFHLPLADGSVDYVTSSLFLHHFTPQRLDALLGECRRVACRGLVMSDLIRHPLPYALYRTLVEPLLVRSPVTVHDGRASFHRAYRPDELVRIAARTLPSPHVRLHLPSFRLQLSSFWNMARSA